ncbi:MAG TPA: hypothetical protein VKM55_14340 [Candidatus Lokiarchaeia archaeon]|nr:hypothetical protein [Candidatus Lokiarchaeia archaeon]
MTHELTYLFPLDFWGDFMNGAKLALANLIGGIIELGMVIALFGIVIGAIAYFSHYHRGGLAVLVNCIVLEIILSCIYMGITGATGPPDISIFFKMPGA